MDINCGRRLAVATSNTMAASCVEVFLTVRAMPEVEVLDDLNNAVARFAYRQGGSINPTCAAAPDIVIGVSPLPGPEFCKDLLLAQPSILAALPTRKKRLLSRLFRLFCVS